ncbi:type III secretion system effector, XopP/hlk family [Mesorhizobium qingshengii]|uniref:Type III secretion system effector, XopP/hlk family n=1 Tax=Mesorhizobium qingshengii TaxID=1165689 RepID=A0A1G5ZYF5_9HYPH|nr:type III secretion system effector, XopP/hlk family [Mesorhizobium qingshengii]
MTGIGRSGKSRIADTGAGLSSSRSQSSLASGEGSQSFGSVLERMSSSAAIARGTHDDLGGRYSGASTAPHRIPAAAPRAAGSRRRSVSSASDCEALAPVATQPSTSGVTVSSSLSGEDINETKRRIRSLIDEIEVLEGKSLHSGTPSQSLYELDQIVNAGEELLQCYASLPKYVARRTLSDADVRQYRANVIKRANSANDLAQHIFETEEEEKRKRVQAIVSNLVNSNATVDQLSRSAPSRAKYHVACAELWDKIGQRHEIKRSVCIATADLPSSTAEMQREEEGALRLESGHVVNSRIMQLQSRINLAKFLAQQVTMLDEPIRARLIGENGQTGLLGNFIGEIFPAFLSTAKAVWQGKGRPFDSEHCAVLEGVLERLADFASALHSDVDRLMHQASAGLPLKLLTRIVDDAWIASEEVTYLLALQPKSPAPELPANADAATPGAAGTTMVAESTTAPRKKGKGKSKQAAGAGSSAAGRPEPQVAAAVSDPAPAAQVLVRTDLGTKKLVSAEEARNSASSAAASLAILQNVTAGQDTKSLVARSTELLKFDLPAQQSVVSRALSLKPEDAEHAIGLAVQRLQTQTAEIEACLSTLEAFLLSKKGKLDDLHRLTVQLKEMLSQVRGLANRWDEKKAAMVTDCMKRYSFPSQNYLEKLLDAEELTPVDPPCALNPEPSNLFEIRLQPKALSNGTPPSPMWVHIHTTSKIYAQQLATLDSAEFAACHVKSNEQRGHNRQWQSSRAKKGYDNAIHRGKLAPAFCKSLLSDRAYMRNGPA